MQPNLKRVKCALRSSGKLAERIFIEPIYKHYLLIALLFLMVSVPDIYYLLFIQSDSSIFLTNLAPMGLGGLLCYNLVLTYVCVVIYSILPYKPVRFIFLFIFILVGMAYFLADSFCVSSLNARLHVGHLGLVKGTNSTEVSEFFSFYVGKRFYSVFALLALSIVTFVLLLKGLSSNFRFRRFCSCCSGGLIAMACVFVVWHTMKYHASLKEETAYGYLKMLWDIRPSRDLHQFLKEPKLMVKENVPKVVMLIFGESLSKSHLSLCGYEKETSPRLSKIESDSLLIVYGNVTSAATQTESSFICMMSTYRPEYKDGVKWYECENLPNIINNIGYKALWISNQSRHGAFDNIITRFAELCAEMTFCKEVVPENSWDENVLPLVEKGLATEDSPLFIYVHLWGSHPMYKYRYPQSYNKFSAEEYKNLELHQRQTIAEYDNSVLYNDYVVSELLNLLKDKEAVAIYCPDHAQDLYESSPDYCGHGVKGPKSAFYGTQIPFMIYTSPLFQERFPETTRRIRESTDQKFRTDDLIYTVMDLIGVRFRDNDDVARYSLLSKQ